MVQQTGDINNSHLNDVNVNKDNVIYINERHSNKKIFWIISIISIMSLLLSLFAICIACYRTPTLSFDYIGVMIGILSFLVAFVTIIFGYNMYGVKNDIKKELNHKLQSEVLELKVNFEEKLSILAEELSMSFYASSYCKKSEECYEKSDYMNCLDYAIKGIECENTIQQRKYTEHCMYLIYNVLKASKLKDAKISINLKNKYIQIISKCNHKRSSDIIDYISRLQIL